ncbi:unnamed protein product [Pedinophyceae sp. YPF-701]|nr:unnamed protein product [Pedinophyceae sp. YPF-701]
MSYYEQQRAHNNSLKKLEEAARRKKERLAEIAAAENEAPMFKIRIDGRACKTTRSQEAHAAQEAGEGLIPWRGVADTTIDRYDGRALLDMYREPLPERQEAARAAARQDPMWEQLQFEAYRDLVRMYQMGFGDDERHSEGVDYAENLNWEIRGYALRLAAASVGLGNPGTAGHDGSLLASAQAASASAEGEDSELPGYVGAADDEGAAREEEAMDVIAEDLFDIEGFTEMLSKAEEAEEQELGRHFITKRKKWSRRKTGGRAKRLRGQGKDPFASSTRATDDFLASIPTLPPPQERPDEEERRDRSARRRSPSNERDPRGDVHLGPRITFINEFGRGSPGNASGHSSPAVGSPAGHWRTMGIIDPRHQDPAQTEGGVALPVEGTIMQGRRFGERRQDTGRQTRPEAARPTSASLRAQPGVKETPQQRIKRLMAAQLNRTIQEDNRKQALKKLSEERDRNARNQVGRMMQASAGHGDSGAAAQVACDRDDHPLQRTRSFEEPRADRGDVHPPRDRGAQDVHHHSRRHQSSRHRRSRSPDRHRGRRRSRSSSQEPRRPRSRGRSRSRSREHSPEAPRYREHGRSRERRHDRDRRSRSPARDRTRRHSRERFR